MYDFKEKIVTVSTHDGDYTRDFKVTSYINCPFCDNKKDELFWCGIKIYTEFKKIGEPCRDWDGVPIPYTMCYHSNVFRESEHDPQVFCPLQRKYNERLKMDESIEIKDEFNETSTRLDNTDSADDQDGATGVYPDKS